MNRINRVINLRNREMSEENRNGKRHDQVLILSFWNPTARYPQQGIFIQEQAEAVCRMRKNIVFMQVNLLPSNNLFLRKTVEESALFGNKRITVNFYSLAWKLWYLNPWAISAILHHLIGKRKTEIDPAIIHANIVFPCGVAAYILAKHLGAGLLISEHWSKTDKLLKHPLYSRIARKAYLASFAVICVSRFLSQKIFSSTGHGNIKIIPNIIDTGIYNYRPKSFSDNGPLNMMCVASWRLPKRLDLIFRAVCSYAAESSEAIELTVAGTGPQVSMYKNTKTPANLKIIWAGYLERPAIAELLQQTHLFLHASDTETFSLVTAEALATGTPVLASRHRGTARADQ